MRLQQIVAGVPTTYTQDYAAPLPIVLQAKTGSATTQYLYSLGTRPIGQYAGTWQYLLPDALGSVRQIADASGNVILTESYEPYGKLLNSTGTASSIFAYAGEQADATGLIYLRARYMQPKLGMFLSSDPVSGDMIQPGSMNGFNYVEGNPINRIDPNGKAPNWPAGELQAITQLKPNILNSAHNHNIALTNMDDNSFAALMTAILHWEGKLPGNGKTPDDQRRDRLGDYAAIAIGYDASTGIANIRPSVALEILQCYPIAGVDYNTLLWLSSLPDQNYGNYIYPSGGGGIPKRQDILFNDLQVPEISLEFLAANLQRGADRITGLGFKASAFNLASWHSQGVQTPEFIQERRTGNEAVANGLSYANVMLESMQDGLAALGLAFGYYLPYNAEEAEFVKVSVTVNAPPYLPVIWKDR